jgi:hypothetical protein
MKITYLKTALALLCAFTFERAAAQIPANDNCTGAINLSVAASQTSCSPITVNTTNATSANYSSGCWSSSYDDDVWFKFIAPTSTVNIAYTNLSVASGSIGYSLFTG